MVDQYRTDGTGAHRQKNVRGDVNPRDYDFTTVLINREKLRLYRTNYAVDKLCKWLPAQALSNGWVFRKGDSDSFKGFKFDKEYEFGSFTEWFHWIGAYEEVLKAIGWEFLFGQSIIVNYLPDDDEITTIEKDNTDHDMEVYGPIDIGNVKIGGVKAYYPYTDSNGYRIIKNGEWYKIYIQNRNEHYLYEGAKFTQKRLKVHQSRVVEFKGFIKELGYSGDAAADLILDLAVIQRQMNRAVYKQMQNLSAGNIVFRPSSDKDGADIQAELEDQYNHLTMIGWMGDTPLDDVVQINVPDLKSEQLSNISLMITKELASSLGLSIRNFGEEQVGSGMGDGGALFTLGMLRARIKEVQRRHTQPLEHLFFLLGKGETAFEWNLPLDDIEETASDDNTDSDTEKKTSQPSNPKQKQKTVKKFK